MDKWKKKTLGEIRDEDIRNLKTVSTIYGISENYKDMIIRQHNEVFDQLSKAVSVGKIMQEILLERMTPQEISAELKKRMMKVEVEGIEEV